MEKHKVKQVKCEHTLVIDGNNAVRQGSPCNKIAVCVLCRSCGSHCYGHSMLRVGLRDRQHEYMQSNGSSES